MSDDLLTYDEVCDRLRISKRTLHRLVRSGHIRPVRLPGLRQPYIEVRELRAFIEAREPA